MKKIIVYTLALCMGVALIPSQSAAQVTASFNTNLWFGSRGVMVTNLQQYLIDKGFLSAGNATGYFGPLTKAALQAYQRARGVIATGYFGPLTRTQMNTEGPIAIGGDRDIHGCTLAGGYMWDNEMQACVRPWEKLSALFAGNTWYLIDQNGTTLSNVYFKISNGSISGRACNMFSGSVSIDSIHSTIAVSKVISTLMACLDNSVTQNESALLSLFNGTVIAQLDASTGILTLTNGNVTLRFTKNAPTINPVSPVNPVSPILSPITPSERCTNNGGSWNAQYNECSGVGSAACVSAGGVYNECASSCRHDPNAMICNMMCVQTCTINQ